MDIVNSLGGDKVLIGEVLVEVDGKYLSRQEGNGIINKFISGDGDPEYADKIKYVIWGYITEAEYRKKVSNTSYLEVWHNLNKIQLNDVVRLVPCDRVISKDQAIEKYMEFRGRKEEGAMVKVTNKLMWRDQSSGTP